MSLQVELKKSAVSQKLPFPSDLALGEIALNYNADGPFLTCKDTAGNIRKLNLVWVGATAPSSPTAGDPWLDTSGATALLRIYDGSAWTVAVTVSLATTSAYGTVRLATSADITNGTAGKIVDAAQLSSKVSGDISTALAASPLFLNSIETSGNATINGNLTVNGTTTTIDTTNLAVEDRNIEIGVVDTPSDATANTGGITLKGATDKTIRWLDATDSWTFSEHVDIASSKTYKINGTDVLTATSLGSGVTDSSLTSVGTIGTGVWQGTAIVDTYLATISTAGKVSNSATTATDANTASAIVARDGSGDFSAGTITAALTGNAATATKLSTARTFEVTGDITGTVSSDLTTGASIATSIAAGVIVDADVNASAAIAGTKISPDFGAQSVTTTGTVTGASLTPTSSTVPTNGVYLPSANNVAISTNGTEAARIDSSGNVGVGTSSPGATLDVRATSGNAAFQVASTSAGGMFTTIYDSSALYNLAYAGGASPITSAAVGTQSAIPFTFFTDNTERARIDSSGKLLVGASSSIGNLRDIQTTVDRVAQTQVVGTSGPAASSAFISYSTDTGGYYAPHVWLAKSNDSTVGQNGIVSNAEVLGAINFAGNDGSSFLNAASIQAYVDGTPGANDMPGRLVFSTTADGESSPTERMRISGDGAVFIGKSTITTSTDGHAFIEDGQYRSSITSNNNVWINRNGTNGAVVIFRKSDTTVGDISVTASATSYNTSSDYRLKENVTLVTDGITRLQQLKPSRFNFIADPDTVVDGFIAHEVQDVVPEAITGEKDAVDEDGNAQYQGIDQSKLVPLLTAALQEAVAKIESLESRLTAAGI